MGNCGVKWDSVLFTVLLVCYLAGLYRLVNGQTTEGGSIDSVEGQSSTAPSPTPGQEVTATTPIDVDISNTTIRNVSQTTINLMLIYENLKVLKEVDEAVEEAKRFLLASMSIILNVVAKVYTDQLDSPIKMVTKLCNVMDGLLTSTETKPDLVLDLTETGVPSEAVKIVTKSLKIPTVSTSLGHDADVREWRGLSAAEEKYLVRISPPSDMADQLIRSLASLQNISNLVVFFDRTFDMYPKYKSLLRDLPTRHKLVFLDKRWSSKDFFEGQLKRLVTDARFANFFVLASPKRISSTIAKVTKMTTKLARSLKSNFFSWYAMSLETGELNCKKFASGVPVSLLYASPVDAHVSATEEKLRNLTKQFYYDLTMDAIMAVSTIKMEQKWPENSGGITCSGFDGNVTYPTLDVDLLSFFKGNPKTKGSYHMTHNGEHHAEFNLTIKRVSVSNTNGTGGNLRCVQEPLGNWTSGFQGQHLLRLGASTDLTFHVPRRVLQIVTVVNPPYVYVRPGCRDAQVRGVGGKHCFYGYSIDVLDRLAHLLNFAYNIRSVPSYGYLDKSPHIGWSGLIRELIDQRADMGIGSLSVLPEREAVVDFATYGYHPMVGFTFAMRKIKVPSNVFSFMHVLEADVWWCILATYFFTTFLLFAFDRWSPSSYQNTKDTYEGYGDELPRIFTIKESLWFCFCSMTPQGGGEAPLGLAGRLVASTWWLFSFVIIASYTANMAAFLTISRLVKPIKNMDDLVNQHKVQFSIVLKSSAYVYYDRLTYIEQIFYERWRDMTLDDGLSNYNRSLMAVWTYPISDKYTKMWQAFSEAVIPETLEDAVRRLRQRNETGHFEENSFRFALIAEETDLRYLTLTECDIKTVGNTFSHRSYGLAVQKGSPLKQEIDTVMAEMAKRREFEYIYKKWWTVGSNPHLKKCPRHFTIEDGIDFVNLSGVFLVTVGGVFVGATWMLVEWCYYLWINRVKPFPPIMNDETESTGRSAEAGKRSAIQNIFANDPDPDSDSTTSKSNFNTDYDLQY